MMENALKFTVAKDGTSLAFSDQGEGKPLIFTNGYATSTFYWTPLLARLQKRHRTITWDLKGHGHSAPARRLSSTTVASCADDLQRVMDAAGVEKATLVGFSFGCQIVLEAWRHFPDRIESLVPILGPYGRPFDNVFHPSLGSVVFKAFEQLGPRGAKAILKLGSLGAHVPITQAVAQQLGMVCATLPPNAMKPFFEHMGRVDAATWHAMGLSAQHHCAEELLPSINVPALVISGGRDTFAPPKLSYRMVEKIPGAHHVHLEDATHTGLLGYSEAIADALEIFLDSIPTKKPAKKRAHSRRKKTAVPTTAT